MLLVKLNQFGEWLLKRTIPQIIVFHILVGIPIWLMVIIPSASQLVSMVFDESAITRLFSGFAVLITACLLFAPMLFDLVRDHILDKRRELDNINTTSGNLNRKLISIRTKTGQLITVRYTEQLVSEMQTLYDVDFSSEVTKAIEQIITPPNK